MWDVLLKVGLTRPKINKNTHACCCCCLLTYVLLRFQGFPNWDPPEFVVAAAQRALSEGFHQYTRTAGHPRLVQLLSKRYSKHFGREVDAFSQVK